DGQAPLFEHPERVRTAVVHEMPADVQQRITVAELAHHVPVPDLLKQRLGTHSCRLLPAAFIRHPLTSIVAPVGRRAILASISIHLKQRADAHQQRTWCTSMMLPSGS